MTSGHCDMDSLSSVISLLNPKAIIPIHTDNPDEFVQHFKNDLSVIRLHDGEECDFSLFDRKEIDTHSVQ